MNFARALRIGLHCCLIALALAAKPCRGEDWQQWRGPNRDGVSQETGLLQQWPSKGPRLAWKSTGLGAGYSGVAIANGKIFTMGDGASASLVFALEEASGQQLWTAPVGKTGGGGGYAGTRSTPTVDGDLVVALNQFGDLVCLRSANGEQLWRKSLVHDFKGQMMSDWGYSESPLVDGNRVVCTPGGPGGAVVALDKNSGAELWRTKDFKDPAAYCSLIIAESAGKRQYIQLTGANVVGIAPEDGRILWRAARPGRVAVITTPIFYDNSVYVSSFYGVGCHLFKISAEGDQFKATQVYANKVMVNHHGGVVRVGNRLFGYSDGKGWVCQDFKTGKSIWEEKGRLGKGSITYADGRLYLRGEDKGTVVLLDPAAPGFKETGRFEQPERTEFNAWPHPVIANGKLYLRDQSALFCYQVKR